MPAALVYNHYNPDAFKGSQWISTADTSTSDRACSALTECNETQFETHAPAADQSSDRQCQTLTVCSGDEYQTVAPTSTSDRTCATHTTFVDGQYESKPAGETTDRECNGLRKDRC